ncbi:MAG: hypothetical protein WBG41_00840 [Acidimicrobiales bacterium]
MSARSVPATGGVTDDPVRLGTMLYTLVEPHRGHQVGYNRWYERDHFYAGCQIGAYNFAGARFVATADLKALRLPPPGASGVAVGPVADSAAGSYLGVYYVLDGHHDEWNRWAVDQVNTLHAAGRMFEHRDHIHTGLYRFEWEHRRDEDGVPAELTLDHRFAGLVSVFVDAAEGKGAADVARLYREDLLPRLLPGTPVASALGFSPLPLLNDAPGDVPRADSSQERALILFFVDEHPAASWPEMLAGQESTLERAGVGRVSWASPFVATVPGTDTYADRLWPDGG